jgi:hypothetical protein
MEAAGKARSAVAPFRIENGEEKASSWSSKAATSVGREVFRGLDAREKIVT